MVTTRTATLDDSNLLHAFERNRAGRLRLIAIGACAKAGFEPDMLEMGLQLPMG